MCKSVQDYADKVAAEAATEAAAESRIKEIFASVQDGDYSIERGAEKLNISVEEFLTRMEKAGYRIPAMA